MMDDFFKYQLRSFEGLEKIEAHKDAPLPLLILLLSGNLIIEHKCGGKYEVVKNYFYQDMRPVDSDQFDLLPEIFAEDINVDLFIEYINRKKRVNFNFFKSLLNELSFCIFLISKGSYTEAFIHLYRCLEYISFSFPSIYIASSEDFINSYKYFKDFFESSKGEAGELAFFKSFINKTMKGDPILESSLDFSFYSDDSSISLSVIKEVIRICEGSKVSIDVDEESRVLRVGYSDVVPFMIIIRNRYFHYSNSGAKNINISNIVDPSILFRSITEKGIYSISSILSVIIGMQIRAMEFRDS